MSTKTALNWVFIGRTKPLLRKGYPPVESGIVKYPETGSVRLSVDGLEGDEQGDRRFHGGPEKAVHHYPADHYPLWRSCYPNSPIHLMPGAFGENLSTLGMTERTVCIGDIYQIGSALVQVSQGRQPCWKLNRRLQAPDAALSMQTFGTTGWYYRVLRVGAIAVNDEIELVERPCPTWFMQRLIRALFCDGPTLPALLDEWRQASEIEQLSPNWRNTFARRVSSRQIEDWTSRLYEPQV
nr:MOSC domain-containing protein [uncultured Undibacterium sp.]